jgi:hypothetical protein
MRFGGRRRRGVQRGRRGRRGGYLPLAGLCVALAVVAVFTIHEAMQPGPWQRVFATREGLTGHKLACGDLIQDGAMFVALPHRSALHRDVEIRYRDRIAVVPVLDVGPWNTDDAYWETGARPAAERGQGAYRRPVNRAGIDLSDGVFFALGLRDNDFLEWRFVHRGYIPLPRM